MRDSVNKIKNLLFLPSGLILWTYWIILFIQSYSSIELLNSSYFPPFSISVSVLIILGIIIIALLFIFIGRLTGLIFQIINACIWITFSIWYNGFIQTTLIEPFSSPELLMGLFIERQPILFIILGIVSFVTFISVFIDHVKSRSLHPNHRSIDWVISFVSILLISVFHSIFHYWNIGLWICVISAIFLSIQSYRQIKSERIRSHEKITPFNIVDLIFSFCILFISVVFAFLGSDFYIFEKNLIWFSFGGLVITLILFGLSYHKKKFVSYKKIRITITAILVLSIVFFEFFNSHGLLVILIIFYGMVGGFIAGTIHSFFTPTSENRKEKERQITQIISGIGFGTIWLMGIFIGAKIPINRLEILQFILLPVLFVYFFTTLFHKLISKSSEQPQVTSEIINKVRTIWRYKRPWRGIFIEVSIVVSILIIGPRFLPYNPDSQGYPTTLGIQKGCVITEISSFTQFGTHSLINPPWSVQDDDINPIITRSMARNEFETINIVLNNWGMSSIDVFNVVVRNSTYEGYETAFSRDPVDLSWNGTSWVWNRFEVKYIVEDPSGYPNSLRNFTSQSIPTIRPGTALSLWITVYSGSDLTTGYYSDEILIQTSQWDYNITLQTRIWDFQLPMEHSHYMLMRNLDEWYYNSLQFNYPSSSFLNSLIDYRSNIWSGFVEKISGAFDWNISSSDLDLYYSSLEWSNSTLSDNIMSWYAIREGLEDFEYLSLLQNTEPTSNLFDTFSTNWVSFENYSLDYREYIEFRELMGNRLHSIL